VGMSLFEKKHKVVAEDYSARIIDAMLRSGTGVYSNSFWKFVKKEYNGTQVFSWTEEKNYIMFDDEKDYMMFLLRM
jgi:hypothetical protein